MSVDSDYQVTYESLLLNNSLQSLSHFRQRVPKQLYQTTQVYPQFFNYNLVSSGRVIKLLRGPNAIIRGFLYQFMKICFEIQVPDKDYIQILKRKVFERGGRDELSPTSGELYSQNQYLKLIAEFIQVLTSQSIPNFELTINQYPIIDEALLKIFNSFLKPQLKKNLEKLQFLSYLFEVTFVTYGRCYKFQQSDVFLYQENQHEIYMAYLNEMEEVSEYDTSVDNSQQTPSQKHYNMSELEINQEEYHRDEKEEDSSDQNPNNIQNSLINMVQDITKHNNLNSDHEREKLSDKSNNSPGAKNYKINQQELIHQSSSQQKYSGQFNKNISQVESLQLQPSSYNSQASENDSIQKPIQLPPPIKLTTQNLPQLIHQQVTKSYQQLTNLSKQMSPKQGSGQIIYPKYRPYNTITPHNYPQIVQSTKPSYRFYQTSPHSEVSVLEANYVRVNHKHIPNSKSEYVNVDQEQLIYRPKMLNTITQISSIKEQSTKKAYELGESKNDSDSKGTFYKQFTATKILQFVKQPHRTKIKLMKNRFRGVRSKNLNKF